MNTCYRIAAPRFALATRSAPCWKCQQGMSMASLGVAAGYHLTDDGENSVEPEAATLTYVRRLNDAARDEVRRLAPWMAWRHTKTAGIEYLANICPGCDAVQGDPYVHSEPGVAFFPLSAAEQAEITVTWLETPLEAEADGFSLGPAWLE